MLRGTLAVALVVALLLPGCFGKDKAGPETIPDPNFTGNATQAPRVVPPVIPPCALRAGDLAWPAGAGATPPEGPAMVTIKRDAYGVPHIYADDAYSLFYGNGYAQAQDRLFEIDLLRHVGRGDSASIAGAAQLGSDFEVHRDLYTAAEIEAQWQAAPEYAKQVLQAFADGVNRYIAEATARNELPGEFAALGHEVHPWMPQDSVASINYLIGYFGVGGGAELGNLQRLARLEVNLGDDGAAWDALGDLTWLRITDSYTTIPVQDRIINGCEDALSRSDAAVQLTDLAAAADAVVFGGSPNGEVGLPPPLRTGADGGSARVLAGLQAEAGGAEAPRGPVVAAPWSDAAETPGKGLFAGFHWGSNAFLLNGSHSATGKPIMWGAPQMGYYKPPVPYQVGLHGAGYDAVGIGVASAPGIVIGRNNDIAWSATSGIEDQADIVQIELDGARSYTWDGLTKAMACHTVTHSTAPAPADLAAFPDVAPPMTYEQEVCRAEGWPVVAINEAAGVAWFKKTTTRNDELPGAFIWLGLATATSAAEFRQLVADFPFTFNFHVADEQGIHFIHTGAVPLRAPGYDPRLPTPSGAAFEWKGVALTGEMDTWATDPSTGYYANWNNGPAYGWRAGDERGLWGPVHRVQAEDREVQKALARTGGKLTHADVEAINWAAARTDSLAGPFTPFLIQAAVDSGRQDIADALIAWEQAGWPWRDSNGDGRYDDPAHAVWDRMYARILALQDDELGDHNHVLRLDPRTAGDPHAGDHGEHNNPLSTMLKALRGTSAHDWCDDVTTPEAETCPAQLAAAMAEVAAELEGAFGKDVASWLEPLHYSGFTAMGAFNADERPMVNRGSWVQVVAMGEGLAGATSAMPPGNSGRINGPETAQWVATGEEPARLTLELDLYWSGQYKPFPLTAPEVDSVVQSEETLLVLPVGWPL